MLAVATNLGGFVFGARRTLLGSKVGRDFWKFSRLHRICTVVVHLNWKGCSECCPLADSFSFLFLAFILNLLPLSGLPSAKFKLQRAVLSAQQGKTPNSPHSSMRDVVIALFLGHFCLYLFWHCKYCCTTTYYIPPPPPPGILTWKLPSTEYTLFRFARNLWESVLTSFQHHFRG